jgi:hypothetical protein
VLLFLAIFPALGNPTAPSSPPETETVIVVTPERERVSAAEVELDRTDVIALPGRSADAVLRATPGLHQSEHGGHGKAFQYFLRGFDAVHGADIAVSLEGVPLNEVSNIHGHGYLDLHFIPRGLLQGASLTPGVARADVGDFGVAGSGDLSLGLAREGLRVEVGGSTDLGGSLALGFRPEGRGAGTFGWVDVEGGRGVGQSRGWRQVRTAVGIDGTAGVFDVRAFALAYRGDFESPGVLRESEIEAGDVGFYDSYPNSGGGISTRVLGGATLSGRMGRWSFDSTVWTGFRDLELRQNFTGWYTNPETGDATLQAHQALSAGLNGRADWAAHDRLGLSVGVDTRIDRIHQTESGIDTDGAVWDPRLDTRIDQRTAGVWATVPARPIDAIALEAGIRAQHFQVGLDRAIDAGLGTGKANANAPVLAPRGLIRFFPEAPVTVFIGGGRGFRSPEARGVESGRAPVQVSDGGEVSAVVRGGPVELRSGVFGTWISNEIVFDHASARFLTSGRTRRLGGYAGLTVRPTDWLEAQLDVTAADGRYVASRELIPYAPRVIVVGQVRTNGLVTGPVVWTSGVRAWWLSQRPLPGGFRSHAPFVADLTARAALRDVWFDFDLDNALFNRWRDGEFFYASDWSGPESDVRVSGLPERHITAGAPTVARLSVGWRL